MQQKLHVPLQCAPSRAQAQMLQVVPSFFCTRNDVMRVTTLNQIFGMLTATATLCGTETALAQNAAAALPPCY